GSDRRVHDRTPRTPGLVGGGDGRRSRSVLRSGSRSRSSADRLAPRSGISRAAAGSRAVNSPPRYTGARGGARPRGGSGGHGAAEDRAQPGLVSVPSLTRTTAAPDRR